MFGSIKNEISELRQENVKLKQSLLFPILIREMVKKVKEKTFRKLNFEYKSINPVIYKSNCNIVKILINAKSVG